MVLNIFGHSLEIFENHLACFGSLSQEMSEVAKLLNEILRQKVLYCTFLKMILKYYLPSCRFSSSYGRIALIKPKKCLDL